MQEYIDENLDITVYKMLDTEVEKYNGSFIDHSIIMSDDIKNLVLEQAYQLTDNGSQKTGFIVLASTDRITDIFKWIGRDLLTNFIFKKDNTLSPKDIEQMIKRIYKDAPDVQLGDMTTILREIADQNRAFMNANLIQMQDKPDPGNQPEPQVVLDNQIPVRAEEELVNVRRCSGS
jgi:hypothetical protein